MTDFSGRIVTIGKAVIALEQGHLVAIPTETVYGLAADATNVDAVRKIFALKGRPADHPLIIHCRDAEQAWTCTAFATDNARRLAAAFWPGPLTLVLPRADWVSPIITGGQDSVAVRVPEHPVARALLARLGKPIVAPSANRFGRVSPTAAEHVFEEFPDSALEVLDGGPCDVGIESTIVDCRTDSDFDVLRPGKITEPEIAVVLGRSRSAKQISRDLSVGNEKQSPRVSGDLPSHYAPLARITVVEPDSRMAWLHTLQQDGAKRVMVIAFSPRPPELSDQVLWVESGQDLAVFARHMYALFRSADREGITEIIVENPRAEGLGIALRDRLARAARR